MTSVIGENSKNYNPDADIDATMSYDTPQMTEEDLAYYETYRKEGRIDE